ncbi:MAG: hypothetical protein HQK91_08660 [Nitrospirae bacterium]|nr:hypothetical protein [Nitrospirota bacterium]MBF0541503.1 hypothetical protein [Nitrospirota bacterium]
MEKWIEVFKDNPYIGLVIFAIFLVYLIITKTKNHKHSKWLIPSFIIMVFIVIIGGSFLAYNDMDKYKKAETPRVLPNERPKQQPLKSIKPPIEEPETFEASKQKMA